MLPEPPTFPLNLKFNQYISRNFDGYVQSMLIKVIDADVEYPINNTAISFIIEQMAGCNGVAIIRGANIQEQYRGKGYGTIINAYLERFAACVGWSVILTSIVKGNAPMEAIMRRRGYTLFHDFRNDKTGNHVCLYFKNLKFKNDGNELA